MHSAHAGTRTRKIQLLAVVAAFLLGLGLTTVSQAAGPPAHGKTWRSGSTLKVFSKLPRRYDQSITDAIGQYNGSGVRIRLKRWSRVKGSQVTLKLANIRESGLSTQGRPRNGRSTILIAKRFDRVARGDGPHFATFLIVHELGHVLGLDHPLRKPRMCSVMNPAFFGVCKRPAQAYDQWLCGVLRPNDRKVLARLYGGKAKQRVPWYCKVPGPPPLAKQVKGARVEVVTGDPGVAARVHWIPVKGVRILIERRDVACAKAKPSSRIKVMEGADANDTLDAARGVAVDPFTTDSPLTVCYSLTLVNRKTESRSKTVQVEATLPGSSGSA